MTTLTEDELRAIEARNDGPLAHRDIPRLAAALREAWEDGKRLQDEAANLDAARREAEAAAAEMRGALATARDTFAHYCSLHMNKGTPEGTEKGLANRRLASMCATALARDNPGAALLAERDAAQAEVKRLRDEQAERVRVIEGMEFRERDLLAERKRLREALDRAIARLTAAGDDKAFNADRSDGFAALLTELRAALKETSNG